MPFEPGHQLSKGPKDRIIFEAALRLIKQNPEKLKAALEAQLDKAVEGDLDALDWYACRLEGKANAIVQTDSTLAITVDINRPKLTPAQWLQTHGIVNEIKDLECVEQDKEFLPQPTPVEGGMTPLSLVGASSQSHHLEILQNHHPEIVQNNTMQGPPPQVVMDENSV